MTAKNTPKGSYSKAIASFKSRAMRKYRSKISKMILFGSVVRGEQTKDSDIDILVLWNGNRYDGLKDLGVIAYDLLLEKQGYISLKVLTPSDFESLRKKKNQFILNVLGEGKVLVG